MQSRLILKYIISFAVSGIFKLKPNLLSHEKVLSKTLLNLKIPDRFVLCTSYLAGRKPISRDRHPPIRPGVFTSRVFTD
jgi:hypothetical protein